MTVDSALREIQTDKVASFPGRVHGPAKGRSGQAMCVRILKSQMLEFIGKSTERAEQSTNSGPLPKVTRKSLLK